MPRTAQNATINPIMKVPKLGLLPKIIVAILVGILCGFFFPDALTRVFLTFNSLFGNFLSFIIPLLIIGLVTPGIADLGRSAGRLLAITALLAYAFTLMSGFMTYGACEAIYPSLLRGAELPDLGEQTAALAPYFTVEMPPLMGVMSALIAAFVMGLGIAYCEAKTIKSAFDEFKAIITIVITSVIIPLLPLYIFGIFLQITVSGQVAAIMGVFLKLIILIFALTALLLVVQFSIAGVVAKKNPFKMLRTMMTAYFTALGTQSSAATIPVTLEQTLKLGVRPELASFTVPLCATIHLSGSTMKIVACAMAIMTLTGGNITLLDMAAFIMMLGVTMVAAPGVPGGAIMAAIGVLQSMLGFDEMQIGLMIALYIAMDSFGTATNVTGDGAVTVIVDKMYKGD